MQSSSSRANANPPLSPHRTGSVFPMHTLPNRGQHHPAISAEPAGMIHRCNTKSAAAAAISTAPKNSTRVRSAEWTERELAERIMEETVAVNDRAVTCRFRRRYRRHTHPRNTHRAARHSVAEESWSSRI